ncbi:MAG: glycogen/starch synthase [Patescibacteria group bacterium]|jgi:starch synthase
MPKKSKIKILFLSAEVAPLAKVGGLGDVAGALPQALIKLGVDIRICLPFYGLINQKKYPTKKIINRLAVPTGDKNETIDVWQTSLPGTKISVYLIKHNFFNFKKIYLGKPANRPDDLKRFTFFTRAALTTAKKLNFKPDVIHANDWHTGLTADFIKTLNRQNNFFAKTKTLYTIHNLASQGKAKPEIVGYAKIDRNLAIIKVDAGNNDINFMVQGVLGSDLVNTVSPTYAKEILGHYQGANLEKILKKRKSDLYGILNGIDTGFFNPATDNLISQKYSLKNLDKKTANKLALQKQLGLPIDKNIALIGLISRLVWQKGLDLITENFSRLNCQFVFLGTGQPELEQQLLALAKKFPSQFSAQIKFDEKLAHLIYAGADIFLMPSRFEPCGLGQMIAMRYGTVPLVRATGGLADTVNGKTGFSFKKYSGEKLYKTLWRALKIYYDQPKTWRQLQLNGMRKDFSWKKSAKEYLKLYKKLANAKK